MGRGVGWQLALASGSTVLFACLLALGGATSIVAVAVVARAYTIGRVQGRMLDFFRLPSGRLVHPYEIIGQLQEDGWVGQYQVVQEAADRIVVLVVPGPAFSPEKAAAFEARAAAVVGPEAKLRAEVVERIEAAPSGKFHLARSLVPATEGEPAWHHSAPVG